MELTIKEFARMGGRARANKLSAQKRKEIATKASHKARDNRLKNKKTA